MLIYNRLEGVLTLRDLKCPHPPSSLNMRFSCLAIFVALISYGASATQPTQSVKPVYLTQCPGSQDDPDPCRSIQCRGSPDCPHKCHCNLAVSAEAVRYSLLSDPIYCRTTIAYATTLLRPVPSLTPMMRTHWQVRELDFQVSHLLSLILAIRSIFQI
jgi:hypothetical protein